MDHLYLDPIVMPLKFMQDQGKEFLEAARQFQRSFVLAGGLQVLDAELQHGLLSIELERPKAENSVRTIPIRSGGVHVNADTKRT